MLAAWYRTKGTPRQAMKIYWHGDETAYEIEFVNCTLDAGYTLMDKEFVVERGDSPLALVEAARQGMGVAVVSAWLVADELKSGALRAALPNYSLPPMELNAVYPSARQVPLKVRAFIDLVQTQCWTIPDLC